MRADIDTVAESGLQFFGKMTAAISHEIKNILAIVNENAGLLEDLALMEDRGISVEPQRLKNISQTVMRQVHRADTIMKNMNRLAHSVDETVKTIDLNDILQLLVALSDRFATTRDIAVRPKLTDAPLTMRTSPFFLMDLLWLCLDYAMDAAGEDRIVELATRKTEAGIRVVFKGLGGLAEAPLKAFPAGREKGLCDLLGAEMEVRAEDREIIIRFVGDFKDDKLPR